MNYKQLKALASRADRAMIASVANINLNYTSNIIILKI